VYEGAAEPAEHAEHAAGSDAWVSLAVATAKSQGLLLSLQQALLSLQQALLQGLLKAPVARPCSRLQSPVLLLSLQQACSRLQSAELLLNLQQAHTLESSYC
jgi:hypothetical protein